MPDCLPLPLRLSLRFMKSSGLGRLARFISAASTAGIAIGVAALIIGLSAMNGFERELKTRVLALVPSAILTAKDEYFANLSEDLEVLEQGRNVLAASPAVPLQGVLTFKTSFAPAAVYGIDPQRAGTVSSFTKFSSCSPEVLDTDEAIPAIILGAGLARRLKAETGAEISMIVPSGKGTLEDLAGAATKTFQVAGILTTGGVTDSALAFIALKDALEISGLKAANTIHVRTRGDITALDEVLDAARGRLPDAARAESWLSSQGKLYRDIELIRGTMYLAMLLVMAVACFNIVASLMMAVSEKSREIAILITMGQSRRSVIATFALMGLFSGLRGTLWGLAAGCAVSLYLTSIVHAIESLFGITLLNADVYFVNFIPSRLSAADVAAVAGCALAMSILAALYPAFKASRLNPAAELRL